LNWQRRLRRSIPLETPRFEVDIISLAPHGTGHPVSQLAYLQYVRSGILKALAAGSDPEEHDIAQDYHRNVNLFATKLADLVEGEAEHGAPEGMIMAPSTRSFNQPYFNALRRKFPNATDLTCCFERRGMVRSGLTRSFEDVLDDTLFHCDADLSGMGSILIVDDILESGKTVAALIARMEQRGLSASARKTVACALLIDPE